MQRLPFLACLVLTFSACGSEPASPTGTGGGAGTGGSAGSAGMGASAGTGGSAGSAGTGTGAGTGGTSSTETDYPTDTSAEGIKAFLDALDHRSATWASGMTAPTTPEPDALSPHGLVQIWYNKALRVSNAAGHSASSTDPNSMAVKELYTGTNVVGHAVMLRTADPKWIYYCTSTEASRCYSGSPENTAIYQTGIANCGCHGGGTLITAENIPLP
jgi:hypothetical protein